MDVRERPPGELVNLRYGSIHAPKREKDFDGSALCESHQNLFRVLVAGAGFNGGAQL